MFGRLVSALISLSRWSPGDRNLRRGSAIYPQSLSVSIDQLLLYVFSHHNNHGQRSQEVAAENLQSTTAEMNSVSGAAVKQQHVEADPDWGEVITVLVGSVKRKFLVHTTLMRRSPFFDACLSVPMKESQEGVVKLPEDDPNAFRELTYWLYHGKFEHDLTGASQATTKKSVQTTTALSDKVITRIKTYLLAKKMMMEELQNSAVDSLHAVYKSAFPGPDTIAFVYDNLEADDLLRSYIIRRLVFNITREGGWSAFKEKHKLDNKNILTQKVGAMEWAFEAATKYASAGNPSAARTACQWHVHVNTPTCR